MTSPANVWKSLTAAFARQGVTGTMVLYWLMSNPDVRAVAPELFEYALNYARIKRVRGFVVGYGPPFERHYTDEHPITHVMMFGGNAMDDTKRFMPHLMKSGKIAVPPTAVERENFHVQFYERMRNAPPEYEERYSVVELKAPLETQRLVIDIDFKLSRAGSINECEASVPGMIAKIRECLSTQFPGRRLCVWHKTGVWRLNTKNGSTSPILRWGVHIYTNVIGTQLAMRFLGDVLRKSVRLPPGGELDNASFTGIGLRMDGSHKIVRCPWVTDTRAAHECRVCQGRRVLVTAPPYPLDETYGEWRRTLLCPLPGEEAWELAPEVQRILSRKRVHMDDAIEAGRKRHLRHQSKEVDPAIDKGFGAKAYLHAKECIALCKMMKEEYPQFGLPTRVHRDTSGNYFFSTAHRHCPFKKGEHSSSTLYIFCDARTRRASLRCRHPDGGDNDPYPCGKGTPESRQVLNLSEMLTKRLFGEGLRTSNGPLNTWNF